MDNFISFVPVLDPYLFQKPFHCIHAAECGHIFRHQSHRHTTYQCGVYLQQISRLNIYCRFAAVNFYQLGGLIHATVSGPKALGTRKKQSEEVVEGNI